MRIEMWDGMGYSHQVDSADLDLIGRWFAEKSKLLMSADARFNHPVQLHIWPSNPDECKLIPEWHRHGHMTRDRILGLAEHLTNISAEWPAEAPV